MLHPHNYCLKKCLNKNTKRVGDNFEDVAANRSSRAAPNRKKKYPLEEQSFGTYTIRIHRIVSSYACQKRKKEKKKERKKEKRTTKLKFSCLIFSTLRKVSRTY